MLSPHLEKVCVERRAHLGAGWRLTWANHINYTPPDCAPPAVVAALQRTLVEVSGMVFKSSLSRTDLCWGNCSSNSETSGHLQHQLACCWSEPFPWEQEHLNRALSQPVYFYWNCYMHFKPIKPFSSCKKKNQTFLPGWWDCRRLLVPGRNHSSRWWVSLGCYRMLPVAPV